MNATPATPPLTPPAAAPAPRRLSLGCTIVLVTFALIAAGMITIGVAAYNAFHLGGEARDLRDAARDYFEPAGSWHPMIEVRAGPVLCGLAREAIIRAADDPDATLALRAARSFQVGVYGVDPDIDAPGRAKFLREASASMGARGWTRVVTVMDGGSTVLVFMRDEASSGDDIECGVLVHDGENVVVVIARAQLAPLMKLVSRHMPERPLEM